MHYITILYSCWLKKKDNAQGKGLCNGINITIIEELSYILLVLILQSLFVLLVFIHALPQASREKSFWKSIAGNGKKTILTTGTFWKI